MRMFLVLPASLTSKYDFYSHIFTEFPILAELLAFCGILLFSSMRTFHTQKNENRQNEDFPDGISKLLQ
jgi:hypothetical protein